MSIVVMCTACGARSGAPDRAAGTRGKCPKCGAIVQVPALSASSAPAAAQTPGRAAAAQAATSTATSRPAPPASVGTAPIVAPPIAAPPFPASPLPSAMMVQPPHPAAMPPNPFAAYAPHAGYPQPGPAATADKLSSRTKLLVGSLVMAGSIVIGLVVYVLFIRDRWENANRDQLLAMARSGKTLMAQGKHLDAQGKFNQLFDDIGEHEIHDETLQREIADARTASDKNKAYIAEQARIEAEKEKKLQAQKASEETAARDRRKKDALRVFLVDGSGEYVRACFEFKRMCDEMSSKGAKMASANPTKFQRLRIAWCKAGERMLSAAPKVDVAYVRIPKEFEANDVPRSVGNLIVATAHDALSVKSGYLKNWSELLGMDLEGAAGQRQSGTNPKEVGDTNAAIMTKLTTAATGCTATVRQFAPDITAKFEKEAQSVEEMVRSAEMIQTGAASAIGPAPIVHVVPKDPLPAYTNPSSPQYVPELAMPDVKVPPAMQEKARRLWWERYATQIEIREGKAVNRAEVVPDFQKALQKLIEDE